MSENKNSIQVIGAGCCRTGTASLKEALEILGYDPCYHMIEVFKNKDYGFWDRVADNKPFDFDEVFAREKKIYKASCDFPSSLFWKEQLEKYPDAKVILTKRDPEKWYKSCSDTVFAVMVSSPFASLGMKVYNVFGGIPNGNIMDKMFLRDCLNNNWEKENILHFFNEHNAQVIAACPPSKLLVYEAGQGWEPICTFLDKPIPAVPYPNVNDTKMFQSRIRGRERVGYAILAGGVALTAAVSYGLYLKCK